MPILEFRCKKNGHVTEKLFLTFAAAEGAEYITCPQCGSHAKRIISVPSAPIFYGDGWTKPAASGKPRTKTADPDKAAREVVEEMGAGNLVKGVKALTKK